MIKASTLKAIDQNLRTDFNRAYAKAMNLHKRVAMEIPSNAKENLYGWLADLPQVKKVVGEYSRARLQALAYRLTNEKYGGMIEIPREDVEDDNYAMYGNVAAAFGEKAAMVPDTETMKALIDGFTAKDYTGSAAWAANKKRFPKDKNGFTNKDTKKLSAANFEAALASLVERTDASGDPLYLGMDSANLLLVVCSDDQSTAESIVKLATLAGGGANPNYGKAQVLVWPGMQSYGRTQLADADAKPWFLLDSSKVVKPLIYQPRVAFELTAQTRLDVGDVFDDDLFTWKTRGRLAVGYGLTEFAFASTGADAA